MSKTEIELRDAAIQHLRNQFNRDARIAEQAARRLYEAVIASLSREELERAELPWHEAPNWAQWAAMSSGGAWFWFEGEPIKADRTWKTPTRLRKPFQHVLHDDWQNSKQRRPE